MAGSKMNCVLTQLGECSYTETGCSDCSIVAEMRRLKKLNTPKTVGETNRLGELICPTCGEPVQFTLTEGGGTDYYLKHCGNCGQALKYNVEMKHPNGYEGVLNDGLTVYFKGREILHASTPTAVTPLELYELLEDMPNFLKTLGGTDGSR